MADIASSDVTVTVEERRVEGKKHINRVKIEFGDGSLTYPANGVPLPAFASFGMVRNLDFIILTDGDDGSGIVWKYDQENSKLRGYLQGIVVSAAGSATMDDFALNTTADPLATAVAVSLTNSTGAGTKYLGAMKELGNVAIAAQTLYAVAIGY